MTQDAMAELYQTAPQNITTYLKAASEPLGINVLDHIIFSLKGYYSFLESNQLE